MKYFQIRRGRFASTVATLAIVTALGTSQLVHAQGSNAGDSGGTATVGARPLSNNAVHAAAPTITASRIGRAVVIDGRLDEQDWAETAPSSHFTQTEPHDGAVPTERTEIRVLYDDEAVYIGARLHAARTKVSSRLGRRDSDLSDSDWFIVVLDSYHDHTGGYRFKVNPAGVIGDEASGDKSWNPVWDVVTSIDSAGWTAELRIPFSQLRFSPASQQVWGVQFYREIRANAEQMSFSYSPRRERGGPSRFGHLLGLREIKRSKTLELLPYVAARAEFKDIPRSADASFANPFRDGRDFFQQVGGDVKYRVTSNFTLDGTLNPDFGQIEADESQVNLSANESFFREQRPFFIEGSNIFRFGTGVSSNPGGGGGMNQILYSRRVGRAPQGSLPSASQYAEIPGASTILGAAKISGRTANGWSLGLMQAVTNRATAVWVDSGAQRYTSEVEPVTNYFAGRAKKDFREGQSNVGGIVTSVHRGLGDSTLALRLRSSAYVGGFDFGHLFAARRWELSGSVVGSYTAGDKTVITNTQRSSARYYQRPDAPHLGVDSAATSISGWSGALNVGKTSGLHWTGNARLSATSPGYEINDLGFQNSADRLSLNTGVNYDEIKPGRRLRKWGASVRPEVRANFAGDILGRVIRADADAQLLNYMGGRLDMSHELSSLDDRLTRGGPLALNVPSSSVGVNFTSDSRRPYTWQVSANERWEGSGAWGQSRGIKFGFKPSDWWSGEIGPNYSRGRGTAQYVTRVIDTLAVTTYGRRYIFAPIRQTTVSTTLRLNLTMSPRLTYAFVAEPFIASGKYGAPMELRAPRAYDFNVYGTDVGTQSYNGDTRQYAIDPDGAGPAHAFSVADNSFNTRSVNATGNLRWEWRPGSSLFLVWQHRRSNPATFGNFDLRRDFNGLFGHRSDNALLFKVSYWLNP